jgi:transcriptional regulator with XRE-family HTH domain
MTAEQCRMARAALQLGVRELANLAEVSPATITRLERGDGLHVRTIAAVRTALERAGVELIPENGGGVGVRLRRGGKKRKAP